MQILNIKKLAIATSLILGAAGAPSQAAVVFTDYSYTDIAGWVDADIANAASEFSDYASLTTSASSTFTMTDFNYVELADISASAESYAFADSEAYQYGNIAGITGSVEADSYAFMTANSQDAFSYSDAVVDVDFTIDMAYSYDFFSYDMTASNFANLYFDLYNYDTDTLVFSGNVVDNWLTDQALSGSLSAGSYNLLVEAVTDADAYIGGTSGNGYAYGDFSLELTAVPVPAAVWLFGSGLLGLVGFARRKAK